MAILRDEYFPKEDKSNKNDIEKIEIEINSEKVKFTAHGNTLASFGVKNGDTIIITKKGYGKGICEECCALFMWIFLGPFLVLFRILDEIDTLFTFNGFFSFCRDESLK
jgi:hypothetical protein